MKKETLEKFEPAYREAYELAKRGNPVVQTMIARARFESGISVLSDEEAVRLASRAASTGFPPAILIEVLCRNILVDDAGAQSSYAGIARAADAGCDEARCLRALAEFGSRMIDSDHLVREIKEVNENGRCVMGAVTLAVGQFIDELEAACREAGASAKQIRLLDRKVECLKDAGVRRRRSDRERIHEIEGEKKSLMKAVASLSASSLATERDGLRSELAATRQRLADAERQAAEASCHLEAKIAEAVNGMKAQAEQAQLERDIAAEERDEAKRAAEKTERRARLMEGLLRKHGLGLAEAFGDAEPAACAEA